MLLPALVTQLLRALVRLTLLVLSLLGLALALALRLALVMVVVVVVVVALRLALVVMVVVVVLLLLLLSPQRMPTLRRLSRSESALDLAPIPTPAQQASLQASFTSAIGASMRTTHTCSQISRCVKQSVISASLKLTVSLPSDLPRHAQDTRTEN